MNESETDTSAAGLSESAQSESGLSESDQPVQGNVVPQTSPVEQFQVEVAYARPDHQVILQVMVSPGTTLQQAIEQSGIMSQYTEIDLAINKVGIFGKLSKKTDELKPGQRVEIYRPLIADPKEVRRKREAEGKRMKKGGGEAEPAPAKS